MEITDFSSQIRNFMPALGLGFLLALSYDILRIVRLILPRGKVFLFASDALFVVLCTLSSYLLITATANGHMRFYIIAAEIIGALIYALTAGTLIYPFAVKISDKIKRFFSFIFSPFVKAARKIRSFVALKRKKRRESKSDGDEKTDKKTKLLKNLKKIKNKSKKSLKDSDEVLYNNAE